MDRVCSLSGGQEHGLKLASGQGRLDRLRQQGKVRDQAGGFSPGIVLAEGDEVIMLPVQQQPPPR